MTVYPTARGSAVHETEIEVEVARSTLRVGALRGVFVRCEEVVEIVVTGEYLELMYVESELTERNLNWYSVFESSSVTWK